ncbi:hypothetical protein WI23_06370 [Burkholderia oklahomensis C6786]|nr:hypothetical protein WI23_06370 [Burkholderia oklahomensis C6786]KUY57519.1 hypothetical protein WI23_19300 [Burkholderia oklahomensis C6786]
MRETRTASCVPQEKAEASAAAARSRRTAAIAGRLSVRGHVDSRAGDGDPAGSQRLRAITPRSPTSTPAEASIRKAPTWRNRDATA